MAQYRIVMPEREKRVDSLLAARRLRQRLLELGATEPSGAGRGEHVRLDGRLYFDVVISPSEDQRAEIATAGAELVEGGASNPLDECLSCGNIPDQAATVCPNCGFREVSVCPHCGEEVPRLEYVALPERVHQCPRCQKRVVLAYHEPLWDDDGRYHQPVVVVARTAA